MMRESEIRGHSFEANLHFPPEPDAQLMSHPLNTWVIDDCAPSRATPHPGVAQCMAFQGYLNPASVIPYPVRPFFECAVGAMRLVADWDFGGCQVMFPLGINGAAHPNGHLFNQTLAEQAGGCTPWSQTPRVRMDLSLPCPAHVTNLQDIYERWLFDLSGTFYPDPNTLRDSLSLPRLAEIESGIRGEENLTAPVQQLSVVLSPQEWDARVMGDLVGRFAQSLWDHSYECRALILNVCEESWIEDIPTEPLAMVSRYGWV